MDKQNYDENIWDICNTYIHMHDYVVFWWLFSLSSIYCICMLYVYVYGYEVNDELQIYWR